jgi:hypothetical protein
MPKGGRQEGAGRPAGVPNKTTIEFKEAVNNLINFATPKMVDWLEKIAEENPDKALDHVYKFAQFGYPLLNRTDGKQDFTHKIIMETAIKGLPNEGNKDSSSL